MKNSAPTTISIDTVYDLDRGETQALQESLSGEITRIFVAPEPIADSHPVSYQVAHLRARRVHGHKPCAHCGAVGRVDMAYRHDVATLRVVEFRENGFGMAYSPDPADYMPLCVRCHRAFDRGSGWAISEQSLRPPTEIALSSGGTAQAGLPNSRPLE